MTLLVKVVTMIRTIPRPAMRTVLSHQGRLRTRTVQRVALKKLQLSKRQLPKSQLSRPQLPKPQLPKLQLMKAQSSKHLLPPTMRIWMRLRKPTMIKLQRLIMYWPVSETP